uniref:alpha-1,2-Mannosidase n=1 Tax=Glossina brevipalpis TaxID=37001 RepID=A0A1A9W529_9MUSC
MAEKSTQKSLTFRWHRIITIVRDIATLVTAFLLLMDRYNNSEIHSALIDDDNNLVTRARTLQDDQDEIELVKGNVHVLPGSNGLTIEEFLQSMDITNISPKQHFHGARNKRQLAVVNAFKHAWNNYREYAWGHDNLMPISETFSDWYGLGLTIVDALDTMYIMGLKDEFAEARQWISESFNFTTDRHVNLFEVTIRVLGGLLSTYHLSGDKIFLEKSIELSNRLLPSFLTLSGIPYTDINLADLTTKQAPECPTSEVTSLQMEFRDISRITNVSLYESVIERVNEKVHTQKKINGLVPILIDVDTGKFKKLATISLGARGDSYYEYLLKQWIQTGQKENDFLLTDYIKSIDGVFSKLLRATPRNNHIYIGQLILGLHFEPKMDHFTCFLPGTLLLGHHFGLPDSHMLLAEELLDTCYQIYIQQPTKLAPETTYFAENENDDMNDIYVKPEDNHNLLRPEFVESLYYFYVLTGNRTYQDMGWTIFQAFETYAKVTHGYTSIANLKCISEIIPLDFMETFWLSETLKYFYLLFSDDRKEIDLEKWVFNTEAHPLPIKKN